MPSEFDTQATTIARPAPFIEAAGTAFTGRLTPLLDPKNKIKTDTFKQQVEAQNTLQQQALQQAASQGGLGTLQFQGPGNTVSGVSDPDLSLGQGVAGFQPFLDESQRLAGVDPITGEVTSAGMTAGMQPYMSPYQQQVIDATQASYQNQRAQGRQSIMDQAVAAGAFGGGREGVQRGVYDAQTTLGATQLEADLRAQNFAQAQAAQQAGIQNQQGLAQLQPQLAQQNISTLSSLGAGQQALGQAQLDATAANTREKAYEEQQRLGFFGQQFAPFTGGFGAASQFSTNTTPPPSTLNTILGVGTMAGGILGGLGKMMG